MKPNKSIIIFTVCVLFAITAAAQVPNQTQIGARPLGMGGAFSAVANDANAIYWNPAGLASLQRQEFTSMYSDLSGFGLTNSYLGGVFPITDNQAAGIDWNHLGFDDSELGYRDDNFNLAYSLRLPFNISVGAKFKYLDRDISLDGTSHGKQSGFGFDFGLLFTPVENLRLAFSGLDMGGTSASFDNDVSEEIYSQQFRFGAAYSPFEGALIAADIDDRIHVGVEYWLLNMLALRGGIQKDLKTIDGYSRSMIMSAGFSTRYRFMQIDYAYEDDPDLPVTHRFGFSVYYNPSLVAIKDAAIGPVPFFRSLYRKYSEDEEFAEVIIKNSSQDRMTVRVTLDIPTVTITPYEEEIVLEPQSTKAYPLKISLSNQILEARGASSPNLVQPVLTISYMHENTEKETSINLDPLYIVGKNTISWSVPERVAAYLTIEDEEVGRFARTVVQQFNAEITDNFANSNLGRATVLFDAIGKLGVVYQADLQTPFLDIKADSTTLDNIQYPSEMLNSRIGDCDDCTILFATLLENLGIETVLLDVFAPGKGHIYLMFDSGIPEDELANQPLGEREFVRYRNKIWFPVETTMFGHPFSSAWRNGAEEYHLRKSQGYLREIDLTDAKIIYKAGQPPTKEVRIPDKSEIDEIVSIDIDAYNTRLSEYASAVAVSMDDPDGVYDAGVFYMNINQNEQALNMMRRALELRPDFGDAINAIGVLLTRQSNYDEALTSFYRASELMPGNAGIRINIAITLYLQGRRADAQSEYDKAMELDRNFKGILKFLKSGGGGM